MVDITKEDVVAVAEALVHEGIRPRAHVIRERLGRGSNTTIKKYLDQWFEAKKDESALPVPKEFSQSWGLLEQSAWRYVALLIQQAEAQVRSSLAESIHVQEAEIRELQGQVNSLEDELENVRADQEHEISKLKLQTADQVKIIAEFEVQRKVDTQTVIDLKTELQSTKENLQKITQELQTAHRDKDRTQAILEAEREAAEREQKNVEQIIATLKKYNVLNH